MVALGAAVLLAGCGVRLDTPPQPLPTADAAESARASLVAQSLATAQLAEALGELTADEALADQVAQVADAALAQADLLGGQWEPPARPDTPTDTGADSGAGPDGGETGEAVDADEDISPQALVDGLSRAAQDAREAIGAAPSAEVADLYTAVAVWRAWAAQVLAHSTGAEAPAPQQPQVVAATWRLASVAGTQELIRGLDAAGFAYEYLAARAEEGSEDYLERARELRALASDLAVASGLAGTAQDPRSALYDTAGVAQSTPAAAAAIESDLVALWVQAPLPSALRATAVDGALASLLEIQRVAPRAALDLTALPGYPAAATDS
ncbi:hypothetical protein ATL40_0888 [Serinibacter salmoneus]|uniref:DUF4439 domain-containing protein n=1 Tax=Serinibacter salmoneus TaxID=556530 RepID=A0A2A9D0G6_9MICO|nr:hypothetical protein ATL40_0888 [Serinibacter salmoneus]